MFIFIFILKDICEILATKKLNPNRI